MVFLSIRRDLIVVYLPMEAVLEGMAEYFSRELSQKVKCGLKVSAKKCQYTGGGVPLGYKIVDKYYCIDEETAPIVKLIYEMYLNQNTMADITRFLNKKQIKTSRGNEYNKNSLRLILTNNFYRGIFKFSDIVIPDGVPRIIDEETFELVRCQMAKNKNAPARSKALTTYLRRNFFVASVVLLWLVIVEYLGTLTNIVTTAVRIRKRRNVRKKQFVKT